ncbi:MAG: CRISPR-associated protein Cas4 [Chloroflexi bacterium]|nr:CRISPR-associated protein Cas4 [Chloroflexota bacterium]
MNDDYLPISMLNQLEYCERRFWLMFVQGEMAINAPVLEGTYQHEQAHTVGAHRERGTTSYRRVYVWCDRLHIIGFTDVVEEQDGNLIPVEYKHGKMGKWLNDHIQLCAQAMCLEERTGQTISGGEIFYWRSRRRVQVDMNIELRARTEAAIHRAFYLLEHDTMPAPIDNDTKCRDCSLEPICLPREVRLLGKVQGATARHR